MCILPNFAANDLTDVVVEGKKLKRQSKTQNLKITIADHPLLEV